MEPTKSDHERQPSTGLDALAQAASMSPTLVQQGAFEQAGMQTGLEQLGEAAKAEIAGEQGTGMRDVVVGEEGSQMNGEPATAQIREPLPGPDKDLPGNALPIAQTEQVEVKTELGDVPMTDAQGPMSAPTNGVAIDVVKPSSSEEVKMETAPKPAPKPKAQPKKKAAPKKGTASSTKPPANKKRKLDHPASSASQSPSRALSSTPIPKGSRKPGSATPTRRSSSVAIPEDEDDEDEYTGASDASDSGELFCVCRKPDDHTVMIGCEGPCEDWFHLKCVDMTPEKTKLVAQWFCPNCTEKGCETLWKRMCRLPGCEEASRLETEPGGGGGQQQGGKAKGKGSKYCCDEHGDLFMRRLIFPHAAEVEDAFLKPAAGGAGTRKRSAQMAALETQQIEAMELGDEQEKAGEGDGDSRGGVLRPGELKALVEHVRTVAEFHDLGNEVAPPSVASITDPTQQQQPPPTNGIAPTTTSADTQPLPFTPDERLELATLAAKRDKLLNRQAMLLDRDKFVGMVEARHKAVWNAMKARGETGKDCCGYDSRLTWSEEEFEQWRRSEEGKKQLSAGELLPPPPPPATAPTSTAPISAAAGAGDGMDIVGGATAAPEENEETEEKRKEKELDELARGVCRKKRCERHRQWYRNQQQDNAFEKGGVRVGLRKVEAEERAVRDRGRVRVLEGLGGG